MSDNTNTGLCPSCASAIWCDTWGQFKCKTKQRYITGYKTMGCASYKKRPKDFEEPKCQCEDCLRNEELVGKEENE